MSGGYFEYFYSKLNMFIGNMAYDYDFEKKRKLSEEEKELKKLLTRLSEVLHDYEWWLSGDIGEKDFKKSYNKFKKKWLKEGK